jgi:hypothetical protein
VGWSREPPHSFIAMFQKNRNLTPRSLNNTLLINYALISGLYGRVLNVFWLSSPCVFLCEDGLRKNIDHEKNADAFFRVQFSLIAFSMRPALYFV